MSLECCPNCERFRDDAAGAAALRIAFYRSAEDFIKVQARVGFPEPYIAVWRQFYEAILSSEAGLSVLGELASSTGGLACRSPKDTSLSDPSPRSSGSNPTT